MVKTIAHRELRNRSAEILRRVEAGESFEVTNHGEVVAVISPARSRLPVGVSPATVRGGFKDLPRVAVAEDSSEALEALRSER